MGRRERFYAGLIGIKTINMKFTELPSFQHLDQNVSGLKVIFKIYRFFRFFGLKNKKLDEMKEQIDDLRNQFDEHKEITTKFNKYFSDDGWIVYDSINFDILRKAVNVFEADGKEKAQKILFDYFSPENIERNIFHLRFCKEFRDRYRFIEFALADYKAKRYYSTIPLLLMVIDGAVNDSVINKGFHVEKIDLNVWDSITSVENGINNIKKIFQKPRRKTSAEPISSPYRHGILHGRDLAYDNYEVAAKSWCFLFVVLDWIRSKSTEKSRKAKFIKETTPASFKELLEKIKNNQEIKKHIEKWQAREISGQYINDINNGMKLDISLPEYVASEYFKFWSKKNYGYMSSLYSSLWKISAGELRDLYDWRILDNFEILSIVDVAPAITEVWARIYLGNGKVEKCKLRLIYETTKGESLPRNISGANWRVVIKDIETD